MKKYTKIYALDGYVHISENGWHTYAGKWGTGVMAIFYKYCRLSKVETTTENLYRFFDEIVIPNAKKDTRYTMQLV